MAAVEAFEEPEFLTPIKDTGEINSVHGIGKSKSFCFPCEFGFYFASEFSCIFLFLYYFIIFLSFGVK